MPKLSPNKSLLLTLRNELDNKHLVKKQWEKTHIKWHGFIYEEYGMILAIIRELKWPI